jgi:hypothetical protein
MVIYEDISKNDNDALPQEPMPQLDDGIPPSNQPYVESQISLHALTNIPSPQTLKLIGYIKHRKVIILIDNNNTHTFIHCCVSQEKHCYIHVVNKF